MSEGQDNQGESRFNFSKILLFSLVIAILELCALLGIFMWDETQNNQDLLRLIVAQDKLCKKIVDSAQRDLGEGVLKPGEVVEDYLKNALISHGDISLAKQTLVPSLESKFSRISNFVQMTHGSHQLPDKISVKSVKIIGDSALVKASGLYVSDGQVSGERSWDFVLIVYRGEWKIAGINMSLD